MPKATEIYGKTRLPDGVFVNVLPLRGGGYMLTVKPPGWDKRGQGDSKNLNSRDTVAQRPSGGDED